MGWEDQNGNDLLMGGEKVRALSFDGPFPISYVGEVLEEPKPVQQRDYDSDELLWWDDEQTRPRLSLVIKLQTDLHDDSDPDDFGVRNLWVKAESQKAIAAAVRRAGVKGLEVGGKLWIEYYDDRIEPPKPGQKKRFPTKLYRAKYEPPPSRGNQALMGPSVSEDPVSSPGESLREVAASQSALLARMKGPKATFNDEPPF